MPGLGAFAAIPASCQANTLSPSGELATLVGRFGISGALAEEVLATFLAVLDTADSCILSDYAKGLLTPPICQQMIACARKQGKTLVVDPKGADFNKYAGCTVIMPNLRETELASNVSIQSDADLFIATDRLRAILGAGPPSLLGRQHRGDVAHI